MNEEFNFERNLTEQQPAQESQPEALPQEHAQPVRANGEMPKKKKLTRQQAFFKDAKDVLMIVCVFMVVYVLFFRNVVVVGNSMYDTLHNGDYLLILNNLVYREPKAGDIVVASKDSFRNGECIIKRVIATEGQVVDIDFETGTVYVDGVALDEPYINSPTTRPEGMQFPLVVEEGCLFVMGDNRRDSMDSRDPAIGLIDKREVLGKAIFLLLPARDGQGGRDYGRIGVID